MTISVVIVIFCVIEFNKTLDIIYIDRYIYTYFYFCKQTMRNLIIGGIATVVVVAGATIFFNWDSWDSLEDLLKEYQKFSEEVKDSKTTSDLVASCENSQNFNKAIQDLEKKLATLQQRKNDILYSDTQEEYIPKLGEQTPDLNNPETDSTEQEEYIPKLGEHPLDFDGNKLPIEDKEYIPRLGEQAPDLGDPELISTEQEEYIPKLGEHPLDFDGNKLPIEDKEYIPRLGEQAPDLGDPELISTEQEEYIPKLGEQPLNFIEDTNTLSHINLLEEEIIEQIKNMKSLCDKEEEQQEEKKIISKSCEDACKKYSECTHYTEDTTEQDRKDAYDSCMIECATWSDETKTCINKKSIKQPADCANLSMCALAEYSDMMK